MIDPVAAARGNTPAISRKSYIHPALIELCRNGQDIWRQGIRLPRATRYLSRYERGLIAFLEEDGGTTADRRSVVSGKRVFVRVDIGGRGIVEKTNEMKTKSFEITNKEQKE